MIKITSYQWALATSLVLCVAGCEPIKKTPEASGNNASPPATNQPAPTRSKPALSPADIEKRKAQFQQVEEAIQAVAGQKSSDVGPDFDFALPSDDWQMSKHGGGSKKQSVWLFTLKKSGLKVVVTAAGTKDDPTFARSAQQVYDASVKKTPNLIREWKVGNFTLRRSFIGFIDDRHGETTISAFSPNCTIEFNIGSESMDRDELFKVSDTEVEAFISKNPKGGYPAK